MPNAEGSEKYGEFINQNQEGIDSRKYTSNAGNWQRDWDSYTQRPTMFNGAEGYTIKDGKFAAKDEATVFNNTKKFTINGGKFNASGSGAEMLNNSKGHVINGGEFTATGGSSAFAYSDGHVINGGTFTATSSISPAPAQYGTAQGSWGNATHGYRYSYTQQVHGSTDSRAIPAKPSHGHSYRPQDYGSRAYSIDSSANPSRSPATHTQPFNNWNVYPHRNVPRVNTGYVAPILPSHSESKGYFGDKGKGYTLGGGKNT
jgi:hypothetical protein